jgi:hypothetical protein
MRASQIGFLVLALIPVIGVARAVLEGQVSKIADDRGEFRIPGASISIIILTDKDDWNARAVAERILEKLM